MEHPLITPMRKVTTFLEPAIWHAFRIACVRRKTSASHEIRRLVHEQLATWHTEDKETDHA